MAQYKDILKDSHNTAELEEELENTRNDLTQQIVKNQETHNKEIEDLTSLMTMKVKKVEDVLKKEKNLFKQQLENEKQAMILEKGKAESYAKLVEQMQVQLDQSQNDVDKIKKELIAAKGKKLFLSYKILIIFHL